MFVEEDIGFAPCSNTCIFGTFWLLKRQDVMWGNAIWGMRRVFNTILLLETTGCGGVEGDQSSTINMACFQRQQQRQQQQQRVMLLVLRASLLPQNITLRQFTTPT